MRKTRRWCSIDGYDSCGSRSSELQHVARLGLTGVRNASRCAAPSLCLQALSALNNPFIVRQAGFLAERLKSEKDELEDQLAKAYELSLLRLPENDELEELKIMPHTTVLLLHVD